MHAAQEEEEGEQGTKDHSHSSSPAPDGVDEDNKKSTERKGEGRRERTRRDGRGAYKWAVLKPREKALLLPQLQPKLTCLLSHFTPLLLSAAQIVV
jgi:hypothetical protein